jgi:ATP-dependent helicase IRC3
MVNIEFGNVTCKLSNIPNERVEYMIANKLSYTIKGFGASNIPKFLYDAKYHMTYTGLIPYVLNVLNSLNIKYNLIDKRNIPVQNGNFKLSNDFTARDYQAKIINGIKNRAIIQAPTGAGKTFIMASLIAKFNVKPVIVIAPKVSLAEQIKDEFEKFFNTKIGILTGDRHEIRDITVCTPMSAINSTLIGKAAAILIDETHFLPSNTIFTATKLARSAYYRIGVSATPWRDAGDDILIEAALNIRQPSLSIQASDLIRKGKLVPCTINFINMNLNIPWQGNYADTYKACITENGIRNKKIVNLALESIKTRNATLILISKISHGNRILNMIKNSMEYKEKIVTLDGKMHKVGNVEFVSGKDNTERRRAVFQAVKDGFCKILIGSTIADEGLDISILDVLILAGGGKSSTRAFQRVGRVLRLHPLKKDAIVYDFMDSNETFYKQAQTRLALYSTEPLWKIKNI